MVIHPRSDKLENTNVNQENPQVHVINQETPFNLGLPKRRYLLTYARRYGSNQKTSNRRNKKPNVHIRCLTDEYCM